MTKYLSTARKAAVALVGVVAQAVSLGVLHGAVLAYAQVVLALATAVGVYVVKNQPA